MRVRLANRAADPVGTAVENDISSDDALLDEIDIDDVDSDDLDELPEEVFGVSVGEISEQDFIGIH